MFEAKVSGDNECFCFEVTEKTYKHLDPGGYESEKQFNEEYQTEHGITLPWRIYPNHILRLAGIEGDVLISIEKGKVTICQKE